MKNPLYMRYYRVLKNDTAVTEVSCNNFKPVSLRHFKRGLPVATLTDAACTFPYFQYSLVPEEQMFYGYIDRTQAILKAKAGALAYINDLIKTAEAGVFKLEQYRELHYDDLNINLVDSVVNKLRKRLNLK